MNTLSSDSAVPCILLSSNTVNARGDDNKFKLQPLPYNQDALEPYISEKTIQFHYGRHLAAYIENTNKLKAETDFENSTIEEMVCHATGPLYNNAAQVFNHYFQFETLQPPREGKANPCPRTAKLLEENFGSFDRFRQQFTHATMTLFGSGYIWLVASDNGQLEIQQTPNAGNPLKEGLKPVLNLDVWEHAYYLDVQNQRARYVENFWKIINWNVVELRILCRH